MVSQVKKKRKLYYIFILFTPFKRLASDHFEEGIGIRQSLLEVWVRWEQKTPEGYWARSEEPQIYRILLKSSTGHTKVFYFNQAFSGRLISFSPISKWRTRIAWITRRLISKLTRWLRRPSPSCTILLTWSISSTNRCHRINLRHPYFWILRRCTTPRNSIWL